MLNKTSKVDSRISVEHGRRDFKKNLTNEVTCDNSLSKYYSFLSHVGCLRNFVLYDEYFVAFLE